MGAIYFLSVIKCISQTIFFFEISFLMPKNPVCDDTHWSSFVFTCEIILVSALIVYHHGMLNLPMNNAAVQLTNNLTFCTLWWCSRIGVLMKIFRPKCKEGVGRGWREKHIEKFCGLYHSPRDVFRTIKSRRMKWVGHVAHVKKKSV